MVLKSAVFANSKLNLDTLLKEIDLLRAYLNEISKDLEDLSNPRIVEVSQTLDHLLNDYIQLATQHQ
ncbi:MAG TPA: aspartyl-phosphate phosphatase Spo0E family protein [Bacillota bacterium]|nr:aspartyl-phosphate phosphatase Spo0E family protein [Bacillota bacterium]